MGVYQLRSGSSGSPTAPSKLFAIARNIVAAAAIMADRESYSD